MASITQQKLSQQIDTFHKEILRSMKDYGSGGAGFTLKNGTVLSQWAFDKVRNYCERKKAAGVPRAQAKVNAAAAKETNQRAAAWYEDSINESWVPPSRLPGSLSLSRSLALVEGGKKKLCACLLCCVACCPTLTPQCCTRLHPPTHAHMPPCSFGENALQNIQDMGAAANDASDDDGLAPERPKHSQKQVRRKGGMHGQAGSSSDTSYVVTDSDDGSDCSEELISDPGRKAAAEKRAAFSSKVADNKKKKIKLAMRCGNLSIILDHHLRSLHASCPGLSDNRMIGACDPMLCPNWGFRYKGSKEDPMAASLQAHAEERSTQSKKHHAELLAALKMSAAAPAAPAAPALAPAAPAAPAKCDEDLVASLSEQQLLDFAKDKVSVKCAELLAPHAIDGETLMMLTLPELKGILMPALAIRLHNELRKAFPAE